MNILMQNPMSILGTAVLSIMLTLAHIGFHGGLHRVFARFIWLGLHHAWCGSVGLVWGVCSAGFKGGFWASRVADAPAQGEVNLHEALGWDKAIMGQRTIPSETHIYSIPLHKIVQCLRPLYIQSPLAFGMPYPEASVDYDYELKLHLHCGNSKPTELRQRVYFPRRTSHLLGGPGHSQLGYTST